MLSGSTAQGQPRRIASEASRPGSFWAAKNPLLDALRQAAKVRDERRVEHELAHWEPVIPIPFESEHVTETVADFGAVVDQIEEGCFAPADLATLHGHLVGATRVFASETGLQETAYG